MEEQENKESTKKILIEVSDPIVLGFRLACGPFVLILGAGFLLFLAFLMLDTPFPSF